MPIKLAILSFDDPKADTSLGYLLRLAKKLNIDLHIINPNKFTGGVFDILLFRAGTNATTKQLESAIELYRTIKARVKIDSVKGLIIANDKSKQYNILKRQEILLPKTWIIKDVNSYQKIKNMTFPHILKNVNGFGGTEVYLAKDLASGINIINKNLSFGKMLAQEFLASKTPRDYRVYVLDDVIYEGAIRTAKAGEFRANVNQGGSKALFQPPAELSRLAKKIAKIIGLDLAAVDFLRFNDRWYFLEINDSFGMKNDPKLAEIILKFCLKKFKRVSTKK